MLFHRNFSLSACLSSRYSIKSVQMFYSDISSIVKLDEVDNCSNQSNDLVKSSLIFLRELHLTQVSIDIGMSGAFIWNYEGIDTNDIQRIITGWMVMIEHNLDIATLVLSYCASLNGRFQMEIVLDDIKSFYVAVKMDKLQTLYLLCLSANFACDIFQHVSIQFNELVYEMLSCIIEQ